MSWARKALHLKPVKVWGANTSAQLLAQPCGDSTDTKIICRHPETYLHPNPVKQNSSIHVIELACPTGELLAHEQQGTGDIRISMENVQVLRAAASLLCQSQDFFIPMASGHHSHSWGNLILRVIYFCSTLISNKFIKNFAFCPPVQVGDIRYFLFMCAKLMTLICLLNRKPALLSVVLTNSMMRSGMNC